MLFSLSRRPVIRKLTKVQDIHYNIAVVNQLTDDIQL
jgi:hypothetical protein